MASSFGNNEIDINDIQDINQNEDEGDFFEQEAKKRLSMNQEERWLELKSNKIILIKVIDQTFYEGHMVLINKNNKSIVFKCSMEQQCYSITPILYFIEPFGRITINVKRFEKLAPLSQFVIKDIIQIITAKATIEVKDANDAKIFLRKDDIYSPEYQLYQAQIEIDNGSNPVNYKNAINERQAVANEYNKQLNMNNVTSSEQVKKYIDEIKTEINGYENKITDLISKLGDMNKNNMIKQPEAIFDKETFDKVNAQKEWNKAKDTFPITMVVFLFCLCLYIGKIIAWIS